MSEITVTSRNTSQDNITVYIDERGVGISPILNFISLLSSNYNTHQNVMSLVLNNSANWQETYHEVNTIQDTLSAGWQETFTEVNLIQNSLSANWEKAFEYTDTGIVDGGNF